MVVLPCLGRLLTHDDGDDVDDYDDDGDEDGDHDSVMVIFNVCLLVLLNMKAWLVFVNKTR